MYSNLEKARYHTVINPVAAVTPASPNIAVAASVTNAVAAMLTTLHTCRIFFKVINCNEA